MEQCRRTVAVIDGEFLICGGDIVTITDNGMSVEVCSKCRNRHSLIPDDMKVSSGPLYPQDEEEESDRRS